MPLPIPEGAKDEGSGARNLPGSIYGEDGPIMGVERLGPLHLSWSWPTVSERMAVQKAVRNIWWEMAVVPEES